MKKLVIVSYIFPPGNRSNAKRPFLMARYLVEQGWDVTVLTSRFLAKKKDCAEMECCGVHVKRIFSLAVLFGEIVSGNLFLIKCVGFFFDGIICPDFFSQWIKKVSRELKKMEYDCGIVHVMPYSSLFLQKYGILDSRWVIDYQESVYPFWKERAKRFPLRKLFLPARLRLERAALASVSGAWFTSNANRLRYIQDGVVPEEKAKYVPLFYDPAMYSFREERRDDGIVTILYGGRLDGSWRSPETFFRAWNLFHSRCPDAKGKIRLKLYGDMDRACENMARELEVDGYIDQHSPVSYSEFLAQAVNADLLLYIDARSQEFFFPGKLVDYFGTSKPVLAFTQSGSSVEQVLVEVGMGSFISDMNSAEKGALALDRFWESYKHGTDYSFSTKKYSIEQVCGNMNIFLRRLCE